MGGARGEGRGRQEWGKGTRGVVQAAKVLVPSENSLPSYREEESLVKIY